MLVISGKTKNLRKKNKLSKIFLLTTVHTVYILYIYNIYRMNNRGDEVKIVISNSGEKPIYEQIVDQVKGMILSGNIEQGEPLPSIRFLAKELRISVITTKRAYEELENEGFITTVPGKGSFVSSTNTELLKEEHYRKIEDYFQKAVDVSRSLGMGKEELIEVLKMLYDN